MVVVVDDDETLLAMTARYLRAKGFDVITSDTPLGVGALVLRHQPMAVVLDVMMPALDGEAIAHLVKRTRQPALIFYSNVDQGQLAAVAAPRARGELGRKEVSPRCSRQWRSRASPAEAAARNRYGGGSVAASREHGATATRCAGRVRWRVPCARQRQINPERDMLYAAKPP